MFLNLPDVPLWTYILIFSGLVIFGVNVFLMFFQVFNYYKNRKDMENFWLILLSMGFSVYAIGDFLFNTSADFPEARFFNMIQLGAAIFFAPLILHFVWGFLGLKRNKLLIYLEWIIAGVLLIFLFGTDLFITETRSPRALSNPFFEIIYLNHGSGPVSYIFYFVLLSTMFYVSFLFIKSFKKGKGTILPFVVGMIIFYLTSINDILALLRLPFFKDNIYMMNFGLFAINISLALVLTARYHIMRNKVNKLNIELENQNETLEVLVDKRTQQLNTANIELSRKNKELLKELTMAQRVQQSLIPKETDFPVHTEFKISASYASMTSVGGDIYDIIKIEEQIYGILMADVSGHGVPAALITAMAKVAFNNNAKPRLSSAQICENVNKELYTFIGDSEHYLTAFFAILDLRTGIIQFTNAGHHPALLFNPQSNDIRKLDTHGFFIGIMEDAKYETGFTELSPDDKILFFTDGIIEARNPREEFYEYERLYDYILRKADAGVKTFVEDLVREINEFCQTKPADDDRALLMIEFRHRAVHRDSLEMDVLQAREDENEGVMNPTEDEFRSFYTQALKLFKEKRYTQAITILEKLKEMDPYNANVLKNLEIAHYYAGNNKRAEDILTAAIQREKDSIVQQRLKLSGLIDNISDLIKKMEKASKGDIPISF